MNTPPEKQKRRVLVTGAAGRIGSYFVAHSHTEYALRLLVHREDGDSVAIARFGEVIVADLLDFDAVKNACAGMDTVVHLGGNASPSATWPQLLDANITGTYNTFLAAKHAGCRRVVYASSIHAVSGYPADVQVKTSDPVNPGDLYGVSKCFGEALGRYMAEKEGLSVIALRIGAFKSREQARGPGAIRLLDAFVSRRDLHQLITRCIEAENIRFAIFHGLSDNRFKRLDISDARERLGYSPVDDAAELNPATAQLDLRMLNHNETDPGQNPGIRGQPGGR